MTVVIGVDLGGTNVRAAVLDGTTILADVRQPTPTTGGAQAVIDTMLAAVGSLLATPVGAEARAIGLGIPGLIDPINGICHFSPNLFWRNVTVAELFRGRFGLPVAMDNDVRVATFGEMTHGAGRDASDFICLAIGTGIGSGIVLGGRLYRGPTFAAGEIGHMTIEPNGPPCNCGNHGCLEALCAAPAIAAAGRQAMAAGESPELSRLSGGAAERIDAAMVALAAEHGDPAARGVYERAGEYLGQALASLANTLNPELIIVGGGVANAGDLLLAPARRVIAARAMPVNARTVRVVPAELGDEAGLIGAGALAVAAAADDRWWQR